MCGFLIAKYPSHVLGLAANGLISLIGHTHETNCLCEQDKTKVLKQSLGSKSRHVTHYVRGADLKIRGDSEGDIETTYVARGQSIRVWQLLRLLSTHTSTLGSSELAVHHSLIDWPGQSRWPFVGAGTQVHIGLQPVS